MKSPDGSESHVVRLNSFGLRGPEPDIPKSADVFRVLCLGDEQVLAPHLAEEDQFCARLRQRLQAETKLHVEVWNAGIPGACPLTEFLTLTHRLAALQPDLVLSFLQPDDLAEDQTYRRFTRMDRQGVPLACRHPLLARSQKPSTLTVWREQFRLVDYGLNWAGHTWRTQTQFDRDFDGASSADLSRLLNDRTIIGRTLQPLEPMAAWCRNSYATLGVVSVEDSTVNPGMEYPLSGAIHDLSLELKIHSWRLARADFATATAWTAEDHGHIADQIAQRVLTDVSGPWSSPYFRPEQPPVTSAGHQSDPETPRMIHRAHATQRKYH